MKRNLLFARTSWTTAAIALAATFFAGASFAQNIDVNPVPKYTVLHPEHPVDVAEMQRLAEAGAALPTWTSSFTYKGTKYPYTMIGTNPAKGSATTTVNMVIIPLIVKVPGQTFDPTKPIRKKSAEPAPPRASRWLRPFLKQSELYGGRHEPGDHTV